MHRYHRLGELPKKRHMALRKPDGGVYYEELRGNKGFVGPSSLLYHIHRPTATSSNHKSPACATQIGGLGAKLVRHVTGALNVVVQISL